MAMSVDTQLSMRLATKFNWADDEDDDFDFDAWKATADTTAPLVEELPLLQQPASGDSDNDEQEVYTGTAAESATVACDEVDLDLLAEAMSIPLENTSNVPSDEDVQQLPSLDVQGLPEFSAPHWLQVHQANKVLMERAFRKKPDAPAYPEMSYKDGERSQYASSWTTMKVISGLDCRFPIAYLNSPLRNSINAETSPEQEEQNQGRFVVFRDPEEDKESKVEVDGQVAEDWHRLLDRLVAPHIHPCNEAASNPFPSPPLAPAQASPTKRDLEYSFGDIFESSSEASDEARSWSSSSESDADLSTEDETSREQLLRPPSRGTGLLDSSGNVLEEFRLAHVGEILPEEAVDEEQLSSQNEDGEEERASIPEKWDNLDSDEESTTSGEGEEDVKNDADSAVEEEPAILPPDIAYTNQSPTVVDYIEGALSVAWQVATFPTHPPNTVATAGFLSSPVISSSASIFGSPK